MKIYVMSIVNSEGYDTGRESEVRLFKDKQKCLDYAHKAYTRDWNENDIDDPEEHPYLEKDVFEKELLEDSYIVLQMPDFHIQYEYSEVLEEEMDEDSEFVYWRCKDDNGRTSIFCTTRNGEPYGDVSVDLQSYGMFPPDENHIYLPAYKLNNEFLEDIVEKLVDTVLTQDVKIGYGKGWLVRLKDNWKEICRKI